MKYPRGTVLKWTKKALDPKREGASQRTPDDRMIVLSHDEVMFVHAGIVEQVDVYKTHDSYVEPAADVYPKNYLRIDAAEVKRCNAQTLVKEFNMKVTKKYEGRRA